MAFFDFLSGGADPSKAAMKYLNQIPGSVNPYYQPYINQGKEANTRLNKEYGNLLDNPNEFYNRIGAGYKESPGYQTRLKAALQAATNSAATGGMAGSPEHALHAAETATDLQSKDYEDYLNHILGIYGQGLQGEQGLNEQGYNASTGYGNILGSNLAQQGGLAYQGQAGRNQNQSNLFNNALKLGASFLPGIGPAISGLNLLSNRSYG